jgi:hypothetical protein
MNVYSYISIRRIILFVNTLRMKVEGFPLTLYCTLHKYNKLEALGLINFKYEIER